MTEGPRSLASRARAAAIELELITPTEPDTIVGQLPGSNTTAVVRCGAKRWIAKDAAGAASVDGDWQAALALHRAANLVTGQTIAPSLVGYSKTHDIMLLEALCDGWSRLDATDLRSPWSIEVVARVATSLARWHQASRSLVGIEPATPWMVALLWEPTRKPFEPGPSVESLLTEILADPQLRSPLEHLESTWQHSHVVHGNVRFDKVLTHIDGNVRLVDWEASGWGDPRWDVAGLLQELRSAELAEGFDTSAHRSAVLDAYAERATSPSPLSEDDPTLQAFIASRLILRAIELQKSSDTNSALAAAHVDLARTALPN